MNRIKKRGELAIEMLAIYGWALIMLLIIAAAFAYFGIGNTFSIIPNNVYLGQGIAVMDSLVDQRYIMVFVKNNLGESIQNLRINVTSCGKTGVMSPPVNLVEAESTEITVPCRQVFSNSKFRSDILIYYNTSKQNNRIPHFEKGNIAYIVEKNCINTGLIGGWTFDKDTNGCYGKYADKLYRNNLYLVTKKKLTDEVLKMDGENEWLDASYIGESEGKTVSFLMNAETYHDYANKGAEILRIGSCSNYMGIYFHNDGRIYVSSVTSTNRTRRTVSKLALNGWYHIAVTKTDDGLVSIYIDGELDTEDMLGDYDKEKLDVIMTSKADFDENEGYEDDKGCEKNNSNDNAKEKDDKEEDKKDKETPTPISGCEEKGKGKNYSYFKGSIDELMIWERVLSREEIKAIYDSLK